MSVADIANAEAEPTPVESVDSQQVPEADLTLAPVFANPADWFVPTFPEKIEQLDVSPKLLAELALKTISIDPESTTSSCAARMGLGMFITESLLRRLCHEQFIEAKGVVGLHNHRFAMLDRGWIEVNRLMNSCSYIGVAPVSLKAYTDLITQQVRNRPPVTRQSLEQAMAGLVLSDEAKQILGLVASSGRSLFLTGPSGNGKTATARALVDSIAGDFWIPHAIEIDGQVIRVFDRHNHRIVEHPNNDYDRRWVRVRPPLVMVGGELTLQSLELCSTDTQRFYEAPVHMKANGGVLVVDDLGRQRCSASELLNRWIVPLEYRIDYLTLSTGKKIQVPFEQIIVFATNLTEEDLADEAFLRRMGYRLHVTAPTPAAYTEIFQRYARSRGLSVDPQLIIRLLERYRVESRTAKCCDPRDLIDRVIDHCKLAGKPLALSLESLDLVWKGYFGGRPRANAELTKPADPANFTVE